MFLVNASPQDGLALKGTANLDHEHTYWLKYLIFLLVLKRNQKGASVSAEQVVKFFCDPNEPGQSRGRAYEQDLVKVCLGSLCQVDVSNLLQISRQKSSDGGSFVAIHLRVNKRGLHCHERKLFQEFAYLQVVVDDPLLPIPNSLWEDFRFVSGLNYGYLSTRADYSAKARRMITDKATRVAKFLAVLGEALDCERRAYCLVFARLEREGISLPMIGDMLVEVQKAVRALLHLGSDDTADAELQRTYRSTREEIRPTIARLYKIADAK